jgi:DNA ligase-1
MLSQSLLFNLSSPQTFNVGTGLSDKQRQKPPKVGAIITYRFQELTKDGVPRLVGFELLRSSAEAAFA